MMLTRLVVRRFRRRRLVVTDALEAAMGAAVASREAGRFLGLQQCDERLHLSPLVLTELDAVLLTRGLEAKIRQALHA